MGWKQIPVGPFDLSGDTDPKLSNDLNTNGHGVKLSDSLPNGGYSGLIINATTDSSLPLMPGELAAVDSAAPSEGYSAYQIHDTSTFLPAIGVCVWKSDIVVASHYAVKILINGLYKNNEYFGGLTAVGTTLYASNDGMFHPDPPSQSNTGWTIQSVGYVWEAENNNTIFYVNPSQLVMSIS